MLMKKIFTLLAIAFFSYNAFAQTNYEDRVINGNMEGDDFSCFFAHDYNVSDNVPARIIEDPTDPTNHCAVVTAIDQGEDVQSDDWATQFFIRVDPKIESGDELKLTMRVRADKAANAQTQAHNEPGDYNFYSFFGDISITEEWQTIEREIVVTDNQVYGDGGNAETSTKELHTVAFNLYVLKEANNYYFDDIKLEVRKPKEEQELSGWFNMIRKGLDTNDEITFNNGTFTTFTGRDGETGVDKPARIVNDPLDGQPAICVTSVKAALYNDDGQAQIYNADGEAIELTNWQSQFFVSGKHIFRTNEKVRFVIEARAEHPTDIESQIHRGPGDYLHYELFGNLALTEDWQRFEFEQTITAQQSGGSTVAFNLNVPKDFDNTYYFRNIEFCANDADVTEPERTLGTQELLLPIPAANSDINVPVDMTPAMTAMEQEDFTDFITGEYVRVQADEEKFTEDKTSLAWTGININEDGLADPDGKLGIEINAETSENNTATFVVFNMGDNIDAYKTINTRLCFDFGGWYYIYNVQFVNPEVYTGIEKTVATSQNNKAIYDLTGRKVANPTKGLYIMDGKKYILK